MRTRVFLHAILLCVMVSPVVSAQWAPLAKDDSAAQRVAWWQQARFGLFIHWGLYAIPARGEWVQWNEQISTDAYAKLADQFSADHFDADAWTRVARDAGAKYMVLTARHHDGFALFDDDSNNFTSVKSAAHRDVVAEYVKAVRKAGLQVGLYYSPIDWRFPGFFFPDLYTDSAIAMREQYHRQINELATRYGKVDILWFDGGGNEWLGMGGIQFKGRWQARANNEPYTGRFDWEDAKVVAKLREQQPAIIINDRTNAPADFRSREGDNALGKFDNQTPWELCTTIVEGGWGYQKDAKIKSLSHLIKLLVEVAGRDGNFILNIGPKADGEMEENQVQRLREIGQWLRQNGESIYGTRGGPWLPGGYGVSTHRGKYVYVHVLNEANGNVVLLPNLPTRIVKMTTMNNKPVAFSQDKRYTRINVPASSDSIDTIVKVELAQSWDGVAVVPVEYDKGWLNLDH